MGRQQVQAKELQARICSVIVLTCYIPVFPIPYLFIVQLGLASIMRNIVTVVMWKKNTNLVFMPGNGIYVTECDFFFKVLKRSG